jgi:hypothetical protein
MPLCTTTTTTTSINTVTTAAAAAAIPGDCRAINYHNGHSRLASCNLGLQRLDLFFQSTALAF